MTGKFPEDTIPIRRTKKEDVLRASSVKRYGQKKHRSVPKPRSADIVDGKSEEGANSITEAEAGIFESLSSQARVVVATLGGKHGAARRPNKWQHLFAGFTVWLSQSEATVKYELKDWRHWIIWIICKTGKDLLNKGMQSLLSPKYI